MLLGLRVFIGGALLAILPNTTHAQAMLPEGQSVVVTDTLLIERLQEIESRSATFERAMRALEAGPIPIHIYTDRELRKNAPHVFPLIASSELAGGTLWFRNDAGEPVEAVVVVKVDVLKDYHRQGKIGYRVIRAIDQVLIHELYGHTVPVAESGDYAKKCDDPKGTWDFMKACVTIRENVIRKEMGLPPTTRYH